MQENPVFDREVRGRWRRPAMAVASCLYSVLLAWATYSTYAAATYAQGDPSEYLQDRFSTTGRDLFFSITVLQIYLASIFAAVVTAPTIVTERESGTLQILRTAPLTVRQLVYGKYFGALLVVLLLTCVPLPAISIAWVMGGISVTDFLAVSVVEFTSGAVCGAIGIYCSTVSKTAFQSLVRAVVLSSFTLWVPVGLAASVGERGLATRLGFGLTLAVALAMLCTERSTAQLRDEKYEGLVRPHRLTYDVGLGGAPVSPENDGIRGTVVQAAGYAPPSSRVARGDEWAETFRTPGNVTLTPVGHWLTFSNPVLQRQLRHSFRFFARGTKQDWRERRSLLWLGAAAWVCWLGLALYLANRDGNQTGLGWMCIVGFLVVTGATVDAATSFSRERSQHMLSSLLLTPLSPRAVAGGKRDAALATGIFYLVLAAPLYAGAFVTEHATATSILLTVVALLTAGCTLGVVCGSICRNAGVAVVLACTCLLGAWGVVTAYVGTLRDIAQYAPPGSLNPAWRPLILWLFTPRGPEYAYVDMLSAFCAALGASALALLPVLYGLRPHALERDQRTWLARTF